MVDRIIILESVLSRNIFKSGGVPTLSFKYIFSVLALCFILISCICVSVFAASPSITVQPVDFYGQIGDTVTVFCRAEGTNLSYQWFIKNASASHFSLSTIRSDTYTVTLSNTVIGRQLFCRITDGNGDSVDTDIVTIYQGNYPGGSVQINTQPLSRSVPVGDTASFSVSAIGATWLTYQWQVLSGNSWIDIEGATQNTLTFVAQAGDNGAEYRCHIRNATSSSGEVYSNSVTLTVTPRPFSSGQMFSILGQSNFTYIETSVDSAGAYHDYTDYLGYNETSVNGLTIYSNSVRSVGWSGYTGGWYSIVCAIPLNIGALSSDDLYHFQFAFSEPTLSTVNNFSIFVCAGTSLVKQASNFHANNPCNVTASLVSGGLIFGTDTWRLLNIDVSHSTLPNVGSDLKYLYICIGTSGSHINDGSIFKFGFTSNSSIVAGNIEEINSNILDISSVLAEISAEMESLNFNVSSINNNLVLIYNLLRNQQTASIVQQITNQIDSIITPTQEWVEIIEELNEQYADQESTLEDLGDVLESLDKPDVEDVLADPADIMQSEYADVGLVTSVFTDVFNYGAFKWMALAVVALVTVSFVLFGKKRS